MEACETPDVVAGRQTQILRESGDTLNFCATAPGLTDKAFQKFVFRSICMCMGMVVCGSVPKETRRGHWVPLEPAL